MPEAAELHACDDAAPSPTTHPSLVFYKSARAVCLDEDGCAGQPLLVMPLHQTLMPPSALGCTADEMGEQYARQVASDAGVEVLRRNWHLLLYLLFPHTARPAAPSRQAAPCAATLPPITSQEVQRLHDAGLTVDELGAMREPATMDRVHYSYIVFLRFFGWRMHDDRRGVLDRHRRWRARYALLARPSVCDVALDASPQYGTFDFYRSALPVILRSLLDLGFLTYGVRLVEFLIEEMQCERLTDLHEFVAQTLLPLVTDSPHVEPSDKQRLRRHLSRLTESESD